MTNKFKLNTHTNTPFEIDMNEPGNGGHALIRITKARHCKSLNIGYINKENKISKSLPSKTFNQVNLVGYHKLTVEANFVSDPEAFVEVEIYTGSWEEMVLTETELSFTASPFYISCSHDRVEFMIGAPGESNMDVKPAADGGFSIVTTIVQAQAAPLSVQNFIADNTEGSQVIKRLYGRIKGRVKGQGFEQRQEENKEKYAENFNGTIIEGFYPVASA